MYKRTAEAAALRLASAFPALLITGPRQSGKSTLARTLFSHLPYLSMEDMDVRRHAMNDPRGFLVEYAAGAIFDEIQHTPELLSYLQGVIDNTPRIKGRFILTGSQNFALSAQISQSLAGRVGILTLLPLTLEELKNKNAPDINDRILKGGYPALHKDQLLTTDFYPSYIATYLERDVRQVKNVENLATFATFLRLCAGRVGQLLNISALAQDCNIAVTTAREWLSVLEASYIIFRLPPYFENFSKRQIKMPKLYFYDTGVACSLLQITSEEQLKHHYLRGALFENLAILEITKAKLNAGQSPNLYFWRDSTGREVDVVAEWEGQLKALEIKATHTFNDDDIRHVLYFCSLSGKAKGYALYASAQRGLYKGVHLLSIDNLEQLLTAPLTAGASGRP